MFDFNKNIKENEPSKESFGVVFAMVFLLIGLYPLMSGLGVRMWALIVVLLLLLSAYFVPKVLSIPNKLWFKFGMMLGNIIAPLIMAFVYFFTVLPIGLIMRLLGKDLLMQKIDKNLKSYWIERKEPVGSMKNQF